MPIPVYAFTGFLDAGKTKFIQETLEDERFNDGTRTLLLVMEEGETEYDPSTYPHKCVYLETIDDLDAITADDLERNFAEKESLDPNELASVAGGMDSWGEDEYGHDAWCVTLWHCHYVTLHTSNETNRQVACWSNHRCTMEYYSGCYNNWAPDEDPLPDTK